MLLLARSRNSTPMFLWRKGILSLVAVEKRLHLVKIRFLLYDQREEDVPDDVLEVMVLRLQLLEQCEVPLCAVRGSLRLY